MVVKLSVLLTLVFTLQAFAAAVQTAVIDLKNVQCYACVMTVKKALEKVEGVKEIKVDLDHKTATVKFDPAKTNADVLIKATSDAGFPSTLRK